MNLFSGDLASPPRVSCACPRPYGVYNHFYRARRPIYINLVVSPLHYLNIEMNTLQVPEVISNPRYIFELHGKLAIAVEVWPESGRRNAKFIRVFKLSDGGTMWEEVTSLDDHTLFLAPTFCVSEEIDPHCSTKIRRGCAYTSQKT